MDTDAHVIKQDLDEVDAARLDLDRATPASAPERRSTSYAADKDKILVRL
ncbi:MAG: hypothetical protein M3R02_26515 [Chloroflexota bacterium]|nr:hypothetical protein [Chloroflexota bacterium]